MKTYLFVLLTFCLGSMPSHAAEASLDPNLEVLRPFLGGWRGEFKRSTPENPLVDTARWERALNGKAIRIIHSINDGVYGGESLLYWDKEQEKIAYTYYTTADFRTVGTLSVSGKKMMAHEKVLGDAEGAKEVRATMELREDGSMVSKAEFLKNGAWEPGHEVTYRRAPDAKPAFK